MALPEENVHDLTLAWWQSLPWCYRDADARQGYNIGPPWEGFNRDPRFVTGTDSWTRTNTSTRPWEASVAFSRRFNVEPGAPVLVRSWHTPTPLGDLTNTTSELGDAALGLMALGETTTTVRVRHTIRNHTGTVMSENTVNLTGDPGQHVDTWWTPDRFGVLHATVEVTVNVPGFMDALQAIHVGLTEAEFGDLPDAASFKIARPYPLLRFLDGVGFQAGIVSDTVEQMHNGGWTDPATAPDIALPYLAAILGLPTDYTDTLTTARLREHLVGLIDGGTPSAGTTAAITAVAKQWLTGDKQVAVIPGITPGAYPSPEERELLAALGQPGAVRTSTPPYPPRPNIYWEGTPGASTSVWEMDGERHWENLEHNGSFERALTGWIASGGTIGLDTTRRHSGTTALKVTPTTTAQGIFAPYITPIDSTDVILEARIYSPVSRTVRVAVTDEGATQASTSFTAQAGQWTTLTYRHTPTPGTRFRASFIVLGGLDPWWIDDITVARAAYAPGRYFDGDTPEPTPSTTRDVWVNDAGVPHLFNPATWAWDPQTEHTTLGQAVLNTWEAHNFVALHTLILLCKADEVPNGNLPAFQEFLNNSGVIPAGHQILAVPANPTWGQWQDYVGDTWATMHTRAPRWVDHHSAGINLGDQP